MGKIFDRIMDSLDKVEISWEPTPVTNNNYYVTINNQTIQVTKEEFEKQMKLNNKPKVKMIGKDKVIDLLEYKERR